MDIIYHYCSISAFFSIIQNKCIRLCDLNKTNDYMEKRWSKKYIESSLVEELENYNLNFDLNGKYDSNTSYLEYYNNEMDKVLFDNRPILSTCFSEENDRLSQWRAYGQDGEGVAIGFNSKLIKKLKYKNVLVEKVIYKEDKQKKKLGEIIKSAIKYIEKEYSNNEKEGITLEKYFINNFNTFCKVLITKLENISCIMKNPAFSEEREVRIIYDPELYNPEKVGAMTLCDSKRFFEKEMYINKYKISPIRFSLKKNQLIAYCGIDFSKYILDTLIKEIVIGPKCKFNKIDVYYFLLENGYDANKINITKSKASYR